MSTKNRGSVLLQLPILQSRGSASSLWRLRGAQAKRTLVDEKDKRSIRKIEDEIAHQQ
jgi:muconolactone delta-isomerase